MQNRKQGQSRHSQVVPATLKNGIIVDVKTNNIPQSQWNNHHGKTAAGNQVNSLRSTEIGQSLLLCGNKGPILSVSKDEAEVFASQYLTKLGYAVKAPDAR